MDITGATAGPPPGHTINTGSIESTGNSASSLVTVIRHVNLGRTSKIKMITLRFTLNKCKYIEHTTYTGSRGGALTAKTHVGPLRSDLAKQGTTAVHQMQSTDMPCRQHQPTGVPMHQQQEATILALEAAPMGLKTLWSTGLATVCEGNWRVPTHCGCSNGLTPSCYIPTQAQHLEHQLFI